MSLLVLNGHDFKHVRDYTFGQVILFGNMILDQMPEESDGKGRPRDVKRKSSYYGKD